MKEKTIQDFKITARETYSLLENKTPFTFIDVRPDDLYNPADYNDGDGYALLHLPFTEFQNNLSATLDKLPDGKLIFICRSGRKTQLVMDIIKNEPRDMAWVEGGLGAWRIFFTTVPVLESKSGNIYQISRPGRGDLSYAIISNGEAALIDPMRQTSLYREFAAAHQAKITAIFDTHNHADRISGGRFLAEETGATYYKHPYDAIHLVDKLPMKAPFNYLKDGDTFSVGSFSIRAIWFPGHTLGMTNFLLTTPENEQFLFTGDGIFMQSIGRPDLMGEGNAWANMLYESLHTRLDFITPQTMILPAHFTLFSEMNEQGLYAATYETILKTNPMMRPMKKDEFISYVLQDVPVAPDEYLEILRVNHALIEVDESRAEELESGKNLCSATIEIPK